MSKRSASEFELDADAGLDARTPTGTAATSSTMPPPASSGGGRKRAASFSSMLPDYKPRSDSLPQDVFILRAVGANQFFRTFDVMLLNPVGYVGSTGKLEGEKILIEDGPRVPTPLWTRPDLVSNELHVHVLRRMIVPPGKPNKESRAHYFGLEKPIVLLQNQVWTVKVKADAIPADREIQVGPAQLGNLSFDVEYYISKNKANSGQRIFKVAASVTNISQTPPATYESPAETLLRSLDAIKQPFPLVFPTDFNLYRDVVRKKAGDDEARKATLLASIDAAEVRQKATMAKQAHAGVCRPYGKIPAPKTKTEDDATSAAAVAAPAAAPPVPAPPTPSGGGVIAAATLAPSAAAPLVAADPQDIKVPSQVYRVDINRAPINPDAPSGMDRKVFDTRRFVLPEHAIMPTPPMPSVTEVEVTVAEAPAHGKMAQWRSATSMDLNGNFFFLAGQKVREDLAFCLHKQDSSMLYAEAFMGLGMALPWNIEAAVVNPNPEFAGVPFVVLVEIDLDKSREKMLNLPTNDQARLKAFKNGFLHAYAVFCTPRDVRYYATQGVPVSASLVRDFSKVELSKQLGAGRTLDKWAFDTFARGKEDKKMPPGFQLSTPDKNNGTILLNEFTGRIEVLIGDSEDAATFHPQHRFFAVPTKALSDKSILDALFEPMVGPWDMTDPRMPRQMSIKLPSAGDAWVRAMLAKEYLARPPDQKNADVVALLNGKDDKAFRRPDVWLQPPDAPIQIGKDVKTLAIVRPMVHIVAIPVEYIPKPLAPLPSAGAPVAMPQHDGPTADGERPAKRGATTLERKKIASADEGEFGNDENSGIDDDGMDMDQ